MPPGRGKATCDIGIDPNGFHVSENHVQRQMPLRECQQTHEPFGPSKREVGWSCAVPALREIGSVPAAQGIGTDPTTVGLEIFLDVMS